MIYYTGLFLAYDDFPGLSNMSWMQGISLSLDAVRKTGHHPMSRDEVVTLASYHCETHHTIYT